LRDASDPDATDESGVSARSRAARDLSPLEHPGRRV